MTDEEPQYDPIPEADPNSWLPEPADRKDGLEVLAFHRGRWRHVIWAESHRMWLTGYGGPFIIDGGRAFAPLPPKPEGAEGFFDYKEE